MKEYKKWLKFDIKVKKSDIAISAIFVTVYVDFKMSKIIKNGPIWTFLDSILRYFWCLIDLDVIELCRSTTNASKCKIF